MQFACYDINVTYSWETYCDFKYLSLHLYLQQILNVKNAVKVHLLSELENYLERTSNLKEWIKIHT